MKLFSKSCLALIIGVSVLSSCSRDRITEDTFSSMDEYYQENRPEVQEFEITNEDSNQPIVGQEGSLLYPHSSIFEDSLGRSISVPYTVQLVELYSYKDMIFFEIPSKYPGAVLDVAGKVWVNALQNGSPLSIKAGNQFPVLLNSEATADTKTGFHGGRELEGFAGWAAASNGTFVNKIDTIQPSKYLLGIGTLGWNTAADIENAAGTTNIEFEIDANGGENIDLWIVFHDYKGCIRGSNLQISDVPVGVNATVLAMAMDQDNNIRFFKEGITVQNAMSIDLEMDVIEEDRFLLQLEGLD